jgi:hypothetical protein
MMSNRHDMRATTVIDYIVQRVLAHSAHIDVGRLRYPPHHPNRTLRQIVMPS